MADRQKVTLVNTGKGPRGAYDADGVGFVLQPGETADVELDAATARRLKDMADKGADLKPQGQLSKEDKERVGFLRAGQDPDEAKRAAEEAQQLEQLRKAQEKAEEEARKQAEAEERKAAKGK